MGDGEVIVAEADESDGSFLKLSPSLAVITNIDLEHLDHYRDIEDIKDAFLQFANIVPFYGSTILCIDDDNVKAILPKIKRRTVTYGLAQPAEYWASDIDFAGSSSGFVLHYNEETIGTMTLNVPGLFNVYNSLATIASRELDWISSHQEVSIVLSASVEDWKSKEGQVTSLWLRSSSDGIREL